MKKIKDQKKRAIWCDLDGTLANVDHRLHILTDLEDADPGERMDAFTSFCRFDTVNKWCAELLWAMRINGYEIIYVTGRSSKFATDTMCWLLDNISWHERYSPILFMREDGDYRPDHIIKKEIYEHFIKPRYDLLFCIEDRPSVAKMIREIGLICFQVDDREF